MHIRNYAVSLYCKCIYSFVWRGKCFLTSEINIWEYARHIYDSIELNYWKCFSTIWAFWVTVRRTCLFNVKRAWRLPSSTRPTRLRDQVSYSLRQTKTLMVKVHCSSSSFRTWEQTRLTSKLDVKSLMAKFTAIKLDLKTLIEAHRHWYWSHNLKSEASFDYSFICVH